MVDNPGSQATDVGGGRAVSIRQAADRFGLSDATIREAVNKLDIPAKRVGRMIRIRVTDLDAWFDRLDDAQGQS